MQVKDFQKGSGFANLAEKNLLPKLIMFDSNKNI